MCSGANLESDVHNGQVHWVCFKYMSKTGFARGRGVQNTCGVASAHGAKQQAQLSQIHPALPPITHRNESRERYNMHVPGRRALGLNVDILVRETRSPRWSLGARRFQAPPHLNQVCLLRVVPLQQDDRPTPHFHAKGGRPPSYLGHLPSKTRVREVGRGGVARR